MTTNNFWSRVPAHSIISGAVIISALIWGMFYYQSAKLSSGRDVLSVTGSAKTKVTSDVAKLTLSTIHVTYGRSLATGNQAVSRDVELIKSLVKSKGFKDTDMTITPVYMDQVYESNQPVDPKYNLRQTIIIQSSDIQKITDISKAVPTLSSQGAIVSVQSLEYYYSKLPELRVKLLSSAIKDAEARAKSIVESTGRKVGSIRSASSGVVQVLPVNSVEISDYGSYDTSYVDKDVMVTVKATFGLK